MRLFLISSSDAFSFYDSLAFDNIYRVFPHEFLCDKNDCFGIRNQQILISDFDHPSKVTASWIVDKIAIDKNKRHHDAVAVTKVWNKIDNFIAHTRPEYLPENWVEPKK